MSNLPPPSFGGPPHQPEQPTVAFTPLPPIVAPSKKNRKLPYLIAGAVIVVAALVVAGIVVFGGSDGGSGNIASRKAGGAVEDAANAARVPRDATGVALRTCPIGGIDQLADKAPAGFDAQTVASGDIQAAVTKTTQSSDPQLIQCAIGDDTLRYGVVAAALPPTDIQDFLDRSLTEASGKFEDTEKFRGGTLLPFCTKPDAGSDRQVICATTWYDSQLLVGLFTSGDGASTDVTTAWLKTELSTLVTNLEQTDPKVKVVATDDTIDTSATADTTGDTSDTSGDTVTTDTTG